MLDSFVFINLTIQLENSLSGKFFYCTGKIKRVFILFEEIFDSQILTVMIQLINKKIFFRQTD